MNKRAYGGPKTVCMLTPFIREGDSEMALFRLHHKMSPDLHPPFG